MDYPDAVDFMAGPAWDMAKMAACCGVILLHKYNLELYMTATELTESTEGGVWGGKSISVFSVLSVAESYKEQIRFV